MENCVLQCDTTGVMVRTSARLTMNMCDLYGSKGAGVEIYPGSVCSLVNNGIHHCRDGILIKDFASEMDAMPSISMENNVIHNNEGFGVILVKPGDGERPGSPAGKGEETPAVNTPEPQGDVPDPHLISTLAAEAGDVASAAEAGIVGGDVASAAGRKWQFARQQSRNKEATCCRAVQDLMEHQIFVSVQGNQFKRNGGGDFGIFSC